MRVFLVHVRDPQFASLNPRDAAAMAQLSDEALDHAIRESRAERARIQAAAEAERQVA